MRFKFLRIGMQNECLSGYADGFRLHGCIFAGRTRVEAESGLAGCHREVDVGQQFGIEQSAMPLPVPVIDTQTLA